jgi:putative spermidine/putrescine transport system permease protein
MQAPTSCCGRIHGAGAALYLPFCGRWPGSDRSVTLTEAAQSLGAGWFTILFRVIVPNLRAALFSAAFLTLAIVMGEFTIASFLVGLRAFGPYIWQVGQNRAYEASALVIISFIITWAFMGLLLLVGRRAPGETPIAGAR